MNRKIFRFGAWIVVWALSGAPAASANSDAQPGPSRIELPVKLYRDYMIIVQGSIGDRDDLNFLIDTGAVPSVVDSRVVDKLNVAGRAAQVSVFTQIIEAEQVVLPRLGLGPIQLENHPVLARDLNFTQRETGIRIDALIGLDVLGWSNFAVDYKAKKLIFGAPSPPAPVMALEIGPGCILIPVQVGNRRLRLMVDTAAPDLMLFRSRVKSKFPKLRRSFRRRAVNLGGAAVLEQVRLPQTTIGDLKLGRKWAVVIPSTTDATPDFDGLLGLNGLGVKQVHFDFQRQLMSWLR